MLFILEMRILCTDMNSTYLQNNYVPCTCPYILHVSKKGTVSWFLMSGIQQGGLYKVTALYNCWNDVTQLQRRKFCKAQMFALFTIEYQCAKM